jgi:hypothetical protein
MPGTESLSPTGGEGAQRAGEGDTQDIIVDDHFFEQHVAHRQRRQREIHPAQQLFLQPHHSGRAAHVLDAQFAQIGLKLVDDARQDRLDDGLRVRLIDFQRDRQFQIGLRSVRRLDVDDDVGDADEGGVFRRQMYRGLRRGVRSFGVRGLSSAARQEDPCAGAAADKDKERGRRGELLLQRKLQKSHWVQEAQQLGKKEQGAGKPADETLPWRRRGGCAALTRVVVARVFWRLGHEDVPENLGAKLRSGWLRTGFSRGRICLAKGGRACRCPVALRADRQQSRAL